MGGQGALPLRKFEKNWDYFGQFEGCQRVPTLFETQLLISSAFHHNWWTIQRAENGLFRWYTNFCCKHEILTLCQERSEQTFDIQCSLPIHGPVLSLLLRKYNLYHTVSCKILPASSGIGYIYLWPIFRNNNIKNRHKSRCLLWNVRICQTQCLTQRQNYLLQHKIVQPQKSLFRRPNPHSLNWNIMLFIKKNLKMVLNCNIEWETIKNIMYVTYFHSVADEIF